MEKSSKFYLVFGVSLLLMLGFGFLPPIGQITPMGMKVLGILLGCLVAWIFGEMLWSSVLALVMLTIYGYGTMGGNFALAFADVSVATMLVIFLFVYGVESCGLLAEVARWIVSQKWAQKSPYWIMIGFFVATVVCSAFVVNSIAVIIILWTLFYEVVKILDLKPYHPFSMITIIGIALFANSSCNSMPYCVFFTLIKGNLAILDATIEVNSLQYILTMLSLSIAQVVGYLLVVRFIFRQKFDFDVPQRDGYKMQLTASMKWMLFYVIVFAGVLVASGMVAKTSWFSKFFGTTLGALGVGMVLLICMMITRVDGKPIYKLNDAFKTMPWDLVFLVGASLCLSGYIVSGDSGIMPTLVSVLEPIVGGKSALMTMLLFLVIAQIITNVINDMVTAFLILPIAYQFIPAAGGSMELFMCFYVMAVVQGMMLPSASAPGALLHGNKDWVQSSTVFKYVFVSQVVLAIAFAAVLAVEMFLGLM